VSQVEILVVDDHESMRSIFGVLLRAFGFTRIREAEDGEAALRALADRPADLVITDLKMPGLDGLGFVRRLRAEARSAAPVVMVTGHASAARVAAARDAGVNEFIVKPVTGQLLADRLRRIIADDRPFVRTQSYVGPCRRRRRPAKGYQGPFRREGDGRLAQGPKGTGVEPITSEPKPR
jgi:DNA-binding response OmpR family regulator